MNDSMNYWAHQYRDAVERQDGTMAAYCERQFEYARMAYEQRQFDNAGCGYGIYGGRPAPTVQQASNRQEHTGANKPTWAQVVAKQTAEVLQREFGGGLYGKKADVVIPDEPKTADEKYQAAIASGAGKVGALKSSQWTKHADVTFPAAITQAHAAAIGGALAASWDEEVVQEGTGQEGTGFACQTEPQGDEEIFQRMLKERGLVAVSAEDAATVALYKGIAESTAFTKEAAQEAFAGVSTPRGLLRLAETPTGNRMGAAAWKGDAE